MTNNLAIYKIIEDDIKTAISKEYYKPHDKIPSENELKAKYDVSRMTIRQALNNLVNDGFLYRHKGKGTFVSEMKLEKNIIRVRGFTEEMNKQGKIITNQVRHYKIIECDLKLSELLMIKVGDPIIYIERVRSGNNTPVLVEQLFLPQVLFQDITRDVFNGSFYDYIENNKHYNISHCLHIIEARNANERIAKMLQINHNDSVLYVSLVTYLDNGKPFEYVKSYYRGDQYRFIQKTFRT